MDSTLEPGATINPFFLKLPLSEYFIIATVEETKASAHFSSQNFFLYQDTKKGGRSPPPPLPLSPPPSSLLLLILLGFPYVAHALQELCSLG